MKSAYCVLMLLCASMVASAQSAPDSADIFFNHLNLDEVVVTSPVGQIKRKQSATPISVVTQKTLRQTASSNIIDAVAKEPGVAQVTTGSGISKPVIRGLGYNRIVTIADGVRQEGQQWGDEHGIEIDGQSVGQVEILKGPASLMYGSDAMAGVLIFHPEAIEPAGHMAASLATEYQTNSGLINYSLRFGGNKKGFVWNGRYSEKFAHAYHNKYDGYVPGTQFHERAVNALLGVNKDWGFTHLTLGYYHITPSMTEGERNPETGDLVYDEDQYPGGNLRTYKKALPYQQIHHYKAVLDNSFSLGNGLLKAIVGYQQNRRQEFEEHHHEATAPDGLPVEEHHHSADEPSLDLLLHTVTYDARYLHTGFDTWKLTAGIGGMFQRSLNKGEEFLIPDYRLFDIGAYATASKNWQKWTLSGGLRFDNRHLHSYALTEEGEERFADFTRNFNALTGSLGTVWHANSHLNIRANVARGFRAPNLSELGSNGAHHGTLRYEIGNPDLKAEHSWQGDLGFDYSSRYISAELALFINRIGNYIYAAAVPSTLSPQPSTLNPQPSALNPPLGPTGRSTLGEPSPSGEGGYRHFRYTQGDALLKGFEAGIDVHPLHQLHIGATYSMVDARQLNQPLETRYLPLTPAPRLTGEVKWEFTHNGDHHSSAPHHTGESQHHHRLDHIFDNAYVAVSVEHFFRQNHYYMADDTETATPAYTLLNLSAGTDILLRNGRKLCELYLIADNLLNCAYQSHLSRLKYADVNNRTGRRGIFNPGRNITIKLIFPVQF